VTFLGQAFLGRVGVADKVVVVLHQPGPDPDIEVGYRWWCRRQCVYEPPLEAAELFGGVVVKWCW